jgi:hypothetical protein
MMHYVNYVGERHTLFVIGELDKLISIELYVFVAGHSENCEMLRLLYLVLRI